MESNVVQKMKKALKHCIEELSPYCDGGARIDDVLEEAKSAIAIPDRNCDVGTEEEQSERFKAFCDSHRYGFNDPHGYRCKEDCPVKEKIDRSDKLCIYCHLAWAQMPYEEGGEK